MIDYNEQNKGPGKPKGVKNKVPKNTSKIKGKTTPEGVNKAVEEANKRFSEGLSGEMKELYLDFSKTQVLPLDDLRELAKSGKARYNIALQSEMQEHEIIIKNAKKEYKEIQETGRLYGRKVPETQINTRLRTLDNLINMKYHLSSQLTTLFAEYKSVLVEIERIEAGQPSGNVNIFNILKGGGDPEKVDRLEEELFKPDSSILDPEDKDYKEETNDN